MSATLKIRDSVYANLLAKSLPKPIHTDQEHARLMEELLNLDEREDLMPEEEALVEILTLLIQDYEEKRYLLPRVPPTRSGRALMEERGLKLGRRSMSRARRLAELLRTPVDCLYEDPMDERGTELGKAIDDVYRAFGSYRVPRDMDVCSHCLDIREIQGLCDKPLRELTSEELNGYVFDAMTTAGDAHDFRYFLPRILELLAVDLCGDWGPEIVLGKLGYGKCMTWPEEERRAIEHFLRELWRWARRSPMEVAKSFGWEMDGWLCGLARTGQDLSPHLAEWENDDNPEAQINLARFIEEASQISPDAYWEDLNPQLRQLQEWAAGQSR